jgi:hypothetical protein
LRRIHKVTQGRGAVIAQRGAGRELVVFRDSVVVRQVGARKDVAKLVEGGPVPIFFTRAVTLGRRIRQEFPEATPRSVQARFRLFLSLFY